MTALHVVYRSYGGENTKGRPAYYSKSLALASLIRAVEAADRPTEMVFVNDGPIPSDRLQAMKRTGEVITLPDVGAKRSFLAALAMPARRGWPARDVVWFAEDDYLYLPTAFCQLGRAADAAPAGDYFGLYALIDGVPPEGGRAPAWLTAPRSQRTAAPMMVDGQCWRVALATTSTFGARVESVRVDRLAFALSMVTATAWDYTACLTYQGYQPFRWQRLAAEPRTVERTLKRRLRTNAAVPGRIAVNLLALRQRRRNRLIWAADPALCTHLESAHLARGTDWATLSDQTAAWAKRHLIGLEFG
ncbi:MAG: hypothetical protein ACR2KJ_17845 [Jatrophihabitans sp.]